MLTWPFYALLFLHIVFLILGFGAVLVIDTFGFLWLIKKVALPLVIEFARRAQALVWIGWTGLVATGILLIAIGNLPLTALTEIKIFLVLMVGVNGIFLHFIKNSYEKLIDLENIPPIYKFRIGLATLISQTGWWGALLIGFFNTNVKGAAANSIPLPTQAWPYMIGIALIFLAIGTLGEVVLRHRRTRASQEIPVPLPPPSSDQT